MALLAASSSSSAASSAKTYDVFISFRGEDTRTNFTSHLHDAFRRKQIATYIDYRLHKGDEISASLLQAIEDSYVSVVVFSKNYATSRWCLDELIHILQCRRDQGQIVIPVFYKVEPSHVRNQSGTYEQAFQKHERDLKHSQGKMHWWKAALTEAANLAGWDSLTFRDESELIQKIVKDVLRKLYHRYPPTELKGLVGVDNNCAEIDLLLREVQSVGIWGMGGIGKTTIARAIFVKYSSQYEGCCFLENVRENSGKHGNGLHDLRYRLLSRLLHEEDLPVGTSITESTFVHSRLSRKKVFVVLDDVSTLEQLEYLAGELDCFGPGSKIIITTRDKHVLTKGVDIIYEVKALEFQNSLQLFCLNAFNQSLPIIKYEELSKGAVAYAKGIPLALKVLGSFLRGKSENEWDSALRKLEKIPNENIQKVLRSSFDGLDCVDKKIFLHIACLLKGYFKESVISLLDSYRFYGAIGYGAIGIKTLEDNALISINNHNCVEMHDLIQEIGWKIVCEESIEKPGRRSLLWDHEEVYDVLTNNKGTDAIEGIELNLSQIKNIHLCDETFKKMTNLKFLRFYCPWNERSCNMLLENGLESFPDKTRALEWYGYPLKSLPSSFCPAKLVKFSMHNSHVEKLWDGVQDIVNLREIDLTGSQQLTELPDFSKASKLERVYLDNCINLRDVHPSILLLHSLTELTLKGCKKLESLKSEEHLRSLYDIDVDGCSNLKEFSVSSEAIIELDLRNTGIEVLHSSIGRSSGLKELCLDGLRLKNLHQLSCLRSLTELSLSSCELIDDWKLHILFDSLLSLKVVRLENCSNITELPSNTKHLLELIFLHLRNCNRLRSLPRLPPSILYLDASNCMSLETVFSLKTCSEYISFENCVKLNEQSLGSIIEDVYSSMMRTAYMHNKHGFGGEKCLICLPGSRVPGNFEYRTRGASITIELPPPSLLLGFLFCIVYNYFSPTVVMGQLIVRSQCYLGDFMVGKTTLCFGQEFLEEKWDHVYLCFDAFYCDNILKEIEEIIGNDGFVNNLRFSFKFDVEGGDVKECGVCPIYVSGYQDFIRQMELGAKKRSRNIDEEELLPQFKKLKLGLDTQTNTFCDIDELEATFMGMNLTCNPYIA